MLRGVALSLALLATPAHAQQQQPSPYEQIADDNIRMGDMQRAVGELQKQMLAFQAALKDADEAQDALQDAPDK